VAARAESTCRKERRNGTDWTRLSVRAILRRTDLYRHGRLQYGDANGSNERLILIS